MRMYLVALLGLLLAVAAQGDEAKPKTEPKPQWQRLLTGANAEKAAELEKRIASLEAADNYADAIRQREELLALRARLQGADHWQTVNVKWDLAAATKVAALSEEKRAGWRKAANGAASTRRLEQQAQYGKALPLNQDRLKWCREVLGEEHPDTASSYNSIAYNLNAQGKYAEAEPPFQKALALNRKVLGEDHPATAVSYNNVAAILHAQGKYAESGLLYQKALDIHREVLSGDHPDTASSYNNVAAIFHEQGRYAEAGKLFQKALDVYRKALGEDHPDTARGYNNVAYNLQAQGEYAQASPLYQKALDIRCKVLGDNHPDTAQSYNNVASNLDEQGKYAEAGPLFQKALDIYRDNLGENHPFTAAGYNGIAHNLNAQGKYVEAEPLFQNVLDIRRKILGENHPFTAAGYNNVAYNLQAQGKYAEAEPLYQKVLDIDRKVRGEEQPSMAAGYKNLAFNLQAQGKYPEALTALESAAHSYEAARLSVSPSGLGRAAFGAKLSPYPFLAAARSRAGRAVDAWTALEANLARGLLDDVMLRRGRGLTPAEQRQGDDLRRRRASLDSRILPLVRQPQHTSAEAAELQRLLDQRRQLEKSLVTLAATVSQREVATLAQFQAALPADTAFIAWVDDYDKSGGVQEHWGCVVRPHGNPHWERLPASASDGQWTMEDTVLPGQFRAALIKSAPQAALNAVAKKLHAQRLAPLSKHLDGVKRLFVAPVNWMAGVPIEALTDQYTVSYLPSATYLARLKDQGRSQGAGLLAVGDPLFPPVKNTPPLAALPPGGLLVTQVLPGGSAALARLQAGDVLVAYAGEDLISVEQLGKLLAAKTGEKAVVVKVWREGQEKLAERELVSGRLGVALAKEPAREAIIARRQADQLLAKLSRRESYAELPGTQVEIARLAELFDRRTVATLTRDKASEQRLDRLRRAGALSKYRYLHFATHGKTNNVRAFESALLLTPPARLPEVRVGEPYLDGRLTAAEVLEHWKLDAELVTLSACESGLGRRGGGDGRLGFAQAFLIAGSRSV